MVRDPVCGTLVVPIARLMPSRERKRPLLPDKCRDPYRAV